MLNLEEIPSDVLRDLKQRGHGVESIRQMTPEQAFTEFCEWKCLSGWGSVLVEVLDALRSAEESDGFDADGSFAHEIYLDGRGDSY